MKMNSVKGIILSVFTSAIVSIPALSLAQDESTNVPPPAAGQTAPAKHKHTSLVFRGKVSAVDTNAMTFTVGKRTFNVTSETKINKNGQPAILEDITVGDKIGGAYKKSDDGKLNATTVNDGKKPSSKTQP